MNDDLASLFAAAPEGPSHDIRFRQGTIVAFDQNTLENTVLVGGTTLADLSLLGVGEVTLLVPGAVVGILSVGDAVKQYVIVGRIVKPNTADATSAVSLLNSQIYTDFIITGEPTNSTTYTDLATIGPRVTVPVGPSGRILIVATAQIQYVTNIEPSSSGAGLFDVEFTGANTRSPNEVVDPLVGVYALEVGTSAGNNTETAIASVTTQAVFSGLNPGDTTVTMKYRRGNSADVDPDFHRRTLTVIKL